jgi:hypothetical protein
MKKLAVSAAFMVFGLISVNAQNAKTTTTAVPTAVQVVDIAEPKTDKAEKKADSKHCGDKKEEKSCGTSKAGEKKSCCASKKAEAKKEEN